MNIPLLRPLLPSQSELAPWLQKIDDNRWYTNDGPLVKELEIKIAKHFTLDGPENVSLVANGTKTMVLTLNAIKKEGTKCLMPSWSFSATGHAALWSGLEPHFVDIDRETGTLSLEKTRKAVESLGADQIGAIIVVSYLGSPVDVDAWKNFQDETGVPVLIDGAAGFDTFRDSAASLPISLSLHATKSFSTGEGGAVISNDADLIKRLDTMKNFGFVAGRDVLEHCANAKLSEYHAAIGLAFHAKWDAWRSNMEQKINFYNDLLTPLGLKPLRGMGDTWVASMYAVDLPAHITPVVQQELGEAGIQARVWWEDGMHTKTFFSQFGREVDMSATESIAKSSIGLPFYADLSEEEMRYVANALEAVLTRHCPKKEQTAELVA